MGIERLNPECLGNLLANVNTFSALPPSWLMPESILSTPCPETMASQSRPGVKKNIFVTQIRAKIANIARHG
jgi:hypothetical protein